MADSSINAWVSSITTHLKRRGSSTVTIHRVPERLRRRDNDAYEPRIISFGPYHHGKPSLQAMEKYKWSFLEAILAFRPQIPCECYIEAIKEEEAKIRTCYTDDFNINFSSKEFVEMMLAYVCFLVGYFLQLKVTIEPQLNSIVGMDSLIRYDILLLENQLPFFILSKIFKLLQFSFMEIAIGYLNCVAGEEKVNFPREPVHHLLHLYHSHCLYTPQPPSTPEEEALIIQTHGEDSDSHSSTVHHEAGEHQPPGATVLPEEGGILIPIHGEESDAPSATVLHEAEGGLVSTHGEESDHQPPSATVLHEAGIKFKEKKVNGSSSLDVTFDNGKVMIPHLVIDTFKKSTLRNLVAFEQLYPNFSKDFDKSFTAYVEFMDFIVNTPADVALLHKEGIIRHFLGSDKKAANFFNDLNQDVYVKPNHYLAPLYKKVHDYQQQRRHKWRAILMRNYCNSPWAVLGIVTGGILLVLTLLQTIFSGLSA